MLNKTAARIYLYSYMNPGCNKFQLSKYVYQSNSDVKRYIVSNKLVEKGYLTYEESSIGKKTKTDITGNVKPLLDVILETPTGKNLNDFDKHVIKKILDSLSFRKLVKYSHDHLQNQSSNPENFYINDPVFFILTILDFWIFQSKEFIPILEHSKEVFGFNIKLDFKNIKHYDEYIESNKNWYEESKSTVYNDIFYRNEKTDKKTRIYFENAHDIGLLIPPKKVLEKVDDGFTHILELNNYLNKLKNNFEDRKNMTKQLIKREYKFSTLSKKIIKMKLRKQSDQDLLEELDNAQKVYSDTKDENYKLLIDLIRKEQRKRKQ